VPTVLGLDGCPGGWAGALVSEETVTWKRYEGFGAGLTAALREDVAVIAVDIPIGLPVLGEPRSCDLAARAWLGAKRSSVFLAPSRELLAYRTHAETSARSRELTGAGVSIQAFGIYARIAAVDAVLTPESQQRVVESHPEIAFLRMAGDLGSKHTIAGRAARAAALAQVLPPFRLQDKPSRVKRDDALDALACAWIARQWLRGNALLLPPDPPRDARGLLMGVSG
jgi:predicted RNase H-like nuclease